MKYLVIRALNAIWFKKTLLLRHFSIPVNAKSEFQAQGLLFVNLNLPLLLLVYFFLPMVSRSFPALLAVEPPAPMVQGGLCFYSSGFFFLVFEISSRFLNTNLSKIKLEQILIEIVRRYCRKNRKIPIPTSC